MDAKDKEIKRLRARVKSQDRRFMEVIKTLRDKILEMMCDMKK